MSSAFPQIKNRRNYNLFDVFKSYDQHVISTDRIHIVWETLNFKLMDKGKLDERNLKFEACWEYADFDLPSYAENPEEAIGKIVRYGDFTALIIDSKPGRANGFTLITTDGEIKYVDGLFYHPYYGQPIEQIGYLKAAG